MSGYASRFEDALLQMVSDEIDRKSANLVSNRMMGARDVDYERGYIAALRDVAIKIQKDVPKQLNEETK